MVLIPYNNTVCIGIRLKIFLVVYFKFINVNVYWHGTGKIYYFVIGFLCEFQGFSPTIFQKFLNAFHC